MGYYDFIKRAADEEDKDVVSQDKSSESANKPSTCNKSNKQTVTNKKLSQIKTAALLIYAGVAD